MTIRTDKRSIDAVRDPALLDRVRALFAKHRAVELELAHALAEVERKHAYVYEVYGNVRDWAAWCGADGWRMRDLCTLGLAFGRDAEFEKQVRGGETPWPNAIAVAPVLGVPELAREGDDWKGKAKNGSLTAVRRDVRFRRVEARMGERPLAELSVPCTKEMFLNFDRARVLESQRARKEMSNTEVLARVLTSYLDANDPARKKGRRRRVPPTRLRPGDRYVPAEVDRALQLRSGGLCEFAGCTRPATFRCHILPHVSGSGRELRDLFHGCSVHHTLYDAGRIRFLGWSAEGRPLFEPVEPEAPADARPAEPRRGNRARPKARTPRPTPGRSRSTARRSERPGPAPRAPTGGPAPPDTG